MQAGQRVCHAKGVVLGSPNRGTKTSKSGTDSQPNSLPDGEAGGGGGTRRSVKDPSPVFYAWNWNSSRHFGLHCGGMGRQLLGDRKRIEEQTNIWDKTIVDRESDLKNWVELFRQFV